MKESYVSYEQARKLKECGFDWEVSIFYTPDNLYGEPIRGCGEYNYNRHKEEMSAPTQALAAKWLRDVKGWHIQVRINGVRSAYWYEIWSTTSNGPVYGTPDDETFRRGQYENYEEALSQGISKALTLLTEKQ